MTALYNLNHCTTEGTSTISSSCFKTKAKCWSFYVTWTHAIGTLDSQSKKKKMVRYHSSISRSQGTVTNWWLQSIVRKPSAVSISTTTVFSHVITREGWFPLCFTARTLSALIITASMRRLASWKRFGRKITFHCHLLTDVWKIFLTNFSWNVRLQLKPLTKRRLWFVCCSWVKSLSRSRRNCVKSSGKLPPTSVPGLYSNLRTDFATVFHLRTSYLRI